MPDELLVLAREQAERSVPLVRVAALLRVARVETTFDPDEARHTFQQALEAALTLSDRDGESLVDEARFLAAAVAPDLLREIPAPLGIRECLTSGDLCQIMLDHGHVDEAVSYLIRYDRPSGFPFTVVPAVMQQQPAKPSGLRCSAPPSMRGEQSPIIPFKV